MNKPKISIIVAMDKNRGIGKDNGLLWHIPEELKRFREITTGHPIIMGRKTYESIGRPLPKRTNIVITRDSKFKAEGCIVVGSLEEAIEVATSVISIRPAGEKSQDSKPGDSSLTHRNDNKTDSGRTLFVRMTDMDSEIFIIGGGQIYAQAMESGVVDKLYVTLVSGEFEPTVFFPEYQSKYPKVVFKKEIEASGTKDGNSETFIVKFLELEK